MMSFLKQVPLFSGLDEKILIMVDNQLTEKSFLKDEVIFSAGEPSDSFYLLRKGAVKLYNTRQGTQKEETVCLIKPNGTFCLSPTLNKEPYHINAKALERTEVFMLPQEGLHDLIDKSHEFAKHIIRFLARKECDLCEEVCDLSLSSTKERLAKFLFQEYEASDRKKSFTLSLNQADIASFLGTVRETVSRDLSSLKKAGVIDFNKGQLKIVKAQELADLANACVRNGQGFVVLD